MLLARRVAEEAARLSGDAASTVFGPAWRRALDCQLGYSWGQSPYGVPRPALARHPLKVALGPVAEWPRKRGFAEALILWASPRQWESGPDEVTYAKVALDFESQSNRPLPLRPG